MSWEERMAARAAQRERDRMAVANAAAAAEQAQWEAEQAEASRAEFEAGPPDGCEVCYVWGYWPFPPYGYSWAHITVDDGDQTCRHDCHAEPYWCGPVAYAAG
jgi:hypothetical protein